ncbi:MAG: hypothetical protein AAF316_03265 [Cyanobacteria bacterium P01_A01_bin.80]
MTGTIQNGIRVEVRANSQTSARLERTVRQLAEISARKLWGAVSIKTGVAMYI